MTQVVDIVRAALGHLRVQDSHATVDEVDARDTIAELNRMMREWEVDGVNLGWSDVSTPEDTLPVPPEAEGAIAYNLALRRRAAYGAMLDPDVVKFAESTLGTLRAQIASNTYVRMTSPDLPYGEGQRPGVSWRDGYFR